MSPMTPTPMYMFVSNLTYPGATAVATPDAAHTRLTARSACASGPSVTDEARTTFADLAGREQ